MSTKPQKGQDAPPVIYPTVVGGVGPVADLGFGAWGATKISKGCQIY